MTLGSLDRKQATNNPLKPLWFQNAHKDEEKFIKWFADSLPMVEEYHKYRILTQHRNLCWYLGNYDQLQEYHIRGSDGELKPMDRKVVPFVFAHIARLVNKRTADFSSLKATFEVFGNDVSEQDRIRARLMKPILKDIKKRNGVDMLFDEVEHWNGIYGESYVDIVWNPKKGDRRPPTEEEKKQGLKFGREGDVELKILDPTFVLPFPARHWNKVTTVIQIEDILNVEEARERYNDKTIQPTSGERLYSFEPEQLERLMPDEVVIYKVQYKPDEFLPDGAEIICTKEKALEMNVKSWKYSHEQFSFERYTQIQVPKTYFSISFVNYIIPLNHHYNTMAGMFKRNIYHTAHPKWFMERGACNIRALGNAATVVQYKAGRPPSLQTFSSITGDAFNWFGVVKSEMEQLANQHPISSGNVPPNTRSGIQISRLEDIAKREKGPQQDRRNDFMMKTLEKTASVAADYLPATSKENISRRVGEANAPEILQLKDTKVINGFSIEIRNSSGFSDSLAGRIEEVGYLQQQVPGILTREEMLDVLAFRSPEKFYDIGTAALRAAQHENELMTDGHKVPPPMKAEDLLVHWREHTIDMQSYTYKQLPDKIRKLKEAHLLQTEMLIEEVMEKNPMFQQRVMQLDRFPIFYNLGARPQPEQTAPAQAAQQNGQAPQ